MNRHLTGIFAIAAVTLAGCTAVPDPPAPADPEPVTTSAAPVEQVADETEHAWVQDLWVYESVSKIDETGELVELTDEILAYLDNSDGDEHALPQGASFVVYPSLKPSIIGADGQPRTDVEILAGVLIDADARGIAILATPDADAPAPVGLNDLVELDLTFLGDLSPGDAISADIAMLQAFMGPAPSDLNPVALLANRLENGQTQFYGSDGEVGVFETQLGQAVAGSTRGQLPAKSGPMMNGFKEGFKGCKGDTKCVSDYFQSFGEGSVDSLNLLKCNLDSECGKDPKRTPKTETPDVTCVVGVKGGGCPEVKGDPHITTVDGRHLSMQAVGEFVGLRGDGLDVQIRTTGWHESRTVSVLSAVAIRTDASTVMVDIVDGDLRIHVDDHTAVLDIGSKLELPDLTVTAFHGVVQASTSGGELITIRRTGVSNLAMSLNVDEDAPYTGLLAGTGLAEEFDAREFYDDFVTSWRVSDDDSAFTYDVGSTTADFTDLTFPDDVVTMDSLSPHERLRAMAICTSAGIVSPSIMAECVFDYAVTGSIEFVRAARVADTIDGLSSGRLESAPAQIDPATVVEAWSATASEHAVGDTVVYPCPAGGDIHTVWGGNDGVYTADSSVCSAAVHSGDLTTQRGGTVTIERTAGQDTYGSGTTRNGVTTRDWNTSWSGSFIITSVTR